MGALTEIEIFDQMETSLRLAAELCDSLAVIPLKGHAYNKLRQQLRLIEGCCKQATAWREDTRWMAYGMFSAECHKRAGDWLRGIKMPDGTRIKIAQGTLHPCFTKLAEVLRQMTCLIEQTKTKATGRVGMILPDVLPGPHRDTKPVGFTNALNVSRGGIIIPDGASVH